MQPARSTPWDDAAGRPDRSPAPPEEQLVARHLPGAYRFARALGADAETSRDLVQEAFLLVWQKRKQDLPEPALASFLRRCLRNLWLAQHRRRRRHEAGIAAAAEKLWDSEQRGDGADLVQATRECLDQLRGRAARAIDLSYAQGLGRRHIAAALGMKPNGVKTLLSRTRRWLEQCIHRQIR